MKVRPWWKTAQQDLTKDCDRCHGFPWWHKSVKIGGNNWSFTWQVWNYNQNAWHSVMGQWWILSFKWKPQLANSSTIVFLTVRIWGNLKFLNQVKECSVCLTSLQRVLICTLPQFFLPSCICCTMAVRQYLLDLARKVSLGNRVDMWVCILFCKVHFLFILVRQVFECCCLEESTAAKVFIPRVITHFTQLKFLLYKESL